MAPNLESISIVEKDSAGELLVSWSFPGLPAALVEFVTRNTQLDASVIDLDFTFTKLKDQWYYFFTTAPSESSPLGEHVVGFSVVLSSKDFNPEKYAALLRLLAKAYDATADPVRLQQIYLSVLTSGKFGSHFTEESFDVKQAWLAAPMLQLVESLREQVMLLWVALLLRKKVIIYAPQLETLLQFVRSVPLLAFHRQNWDVLRPHSLLTAAELDDLKAQNAYVVGVTDSTARSQIANWDLFVDVSAGTCDVAPDAKADFAMGSFHSQLAKIMLAALEQQQSQTAVVKAVALKTRELLDQLESIVSEDGLAGLQTRGLAPVMERFCINLAVAENLGA